MKYKLKKIRITRAEKGVLLSLVLLIGLVILLYPEQTHDDEVFKEVVNTQTILASFKYEGTKIHEQIFEDEYANVVYEDENNQIASHLIDIKKEKEVTIEEFLKLDQIGAFNDKINELLLLKYPKKIANILHEAGKQYVFNEHYLMIHFAAPELEKKYGESYNLMVHYNEIADFLNFAVPKEDIHYNESGYDLLDPNKMTVIFTFDDGPTGKRTTKIIDLLEDYKMSATFFMVGNKLEGDAATVKYVHNSHSEVAYHSYAHQSFTEQSTETIQKEFDISNTALKLITGEGFKYTRPPYGNYNENTLQAIENAFFRWNIDTNDWRYRDPEYIYDHVLTEMKDGSIILFHDTYDTTVESVEKLLPKLYDMNVQVVSLTEYANLRGISYENHEVYYSFVTEEE